MNELQRRHQVHLGLSGLHVVIDKVSEEFARFARDYVIPETGDVDIAVSVTDEELAEERVISARERELEGHAPYEFSWAEYEKTAVHRKIAEALPAFSRLVFHGSAVCRDGECYLFTAKSGTGKTTHTRLWLQEFPACFVVNGDKPILQVTEGAVLVSGTPWAGKEGYQTPATYPLKSLAILERGDCDSITPLSYSEAFLVLFQQTFRPQGKDNVKATLEMLDGIGKSSSLFRLRCTMQPEAAHVAYEAMSRAVKR